MWVSCSIFSDRSAAGFAIEQRGDTGGWNGTTEQVALSFCATIEHQIDELAFVFDSRPWSSNQTLQQGRL